MAHPAVTWLTWQSCLKPPGFNGTLPMSRFMNICGILQCLTCSYRLLGYLFCFPLWQKEGSSKAWEKFESIICSNMRRKRLLKLLNLSHFKVIGMELICFCCYITNTLNLLLSSEFPFLEMPASVTIGSTPPTQTTSQLTREASLGQNSFLA